MTTKNFLYSIRTYRIPSVLNILGLAAAFAALYIIFVQVNYDYSFNKGIKNWEDIYCVEIKSWSDTNGFSLNTPRPLNEDVIATVPGIECIAGERCVNIEESYYTFKDGEKKEFTLKTRGVTSSFPKLFNIDIIKGDSQSLDKPRTIMLSKKFANAHNLDIGNTIYSQEAINAGKQGEYTIGPNIEDCPLNSNFGNYVSFL